MGRLNHNRPQLRITDSGKRAEASELHRQLHPVEPGKVAGDPASLAKLSKKELRLRRLKEQSAAPAAVTRRKPRLSPADASKLWQEQGTKRRRKKKTKAPKSGVKRKAAVPLDLPTL